MSDLLVEELKQVDINNTTATPDVGSATERSSDKEQTHAILGSGSTRQTEQTHGQSIDVHVSRIRPSDYDTGLTSPIAQRFTRDTTGLTSPTAQRFTRDTTPGLHSPRKRTLSPIRASVNRGRSRSPDKYSSVQRELRTSSPERTFVMSKSPDRSRIWSQWDLPDNKKECLQDYNVRQMEWLYGKPLGGQVETALHWYREVGSYGLVSCVKDPATKSLFLFHQLFVTPPSREGLDGGGGGGLVFSIH